MNYYEAKFAREAKEVPSNWVIFPLGSFRYKLVEIKPAPKTESGTYTVPHLTLVK